MFEAAARKQTQVQEDNGNGTVVRNLSPFHKSNDDNCIHKYYIALIIIAFLTFFKSKLDEKGCHFFLQRSKRVCREKFFM